MMKQERKNADKHNRQVSKPVERGAGVLVKSSVSTARDHMKTSEDNIIQETWLKEQKISSSTDESDVPLIPAG